MVMSFFGCNKHKSDVPPYVDTSIVITAPASVGYNVANPTDYITITITANNRTFDGMFFIAVYKDGVRSASFFVPELSPNEVYVVNYQLLNDTAEPITYPGPWFVNHEFYVVTTAMSPPYQIINVEYELGVLPSPG